MTGTKHKKTVLFQYMYGEREPVSGDGVKNIQDAPWWVPLGCQLQKHLIASSISRSCSKLHRNLAMTVRCLFSRIGSHTFLGGFVWRTVTSEWWSWWSVYGLDAGQLSEKGNTGLTGWKVQLSTNWCVGQERCAKKCMRRKAVHLVLIVRAIECIFLCRFQKMRDSRSIYLPVNHIWHKGEYAKFHFPLSNMRIWFSSSLPSFTKGYPKNDSL